MFPKIVRALSVLGVVYFSDLQQKCQTILLYICILRYTLWSPTSAAVPVRPSSEGEALLGHLFYFLLPVLKLPM